jgi:hypothetical protein
VPEVLDDRPLRSMNGGTLALTLCNVKSHRMPPPRPYHSQVVVANAALSPRLFADFYSYGRAEAPAPLICYWSGAISEQEYERRRQTHPSVLLNQFEKADHRAALPDLLVFSVPPIAPCDRTELVGRLVRTFSLEVLPATPNPRPTAIGYVGYSVGAFLATALALERGDSRAVATLGGVGMASAVADSPLSLHRRLHLASFVNDDDPCRDETRDFVEVARSIGARLMVDRRRGGHDLIDYVENGSVRSAFAFATEKATRRFS